MKTPVEFVTELVSDLVGNPDQVLVKKTEDEKGILLTVHAAKQDLGSIIGKEGRTAVAIRTLTRVFASGQNIDTPVAIKISE